MPSGLFENNRTYKLFAFKSHTYPHTHTHTHTHTEVADNVYVKNMRKISLRWGKIYD